MKTLFVLIVSLAAASAFAQETPKPEDSFEKIRSVLLKRLMALEKEARVEAETISSSRVAECEQKLVTVRAAKINRMATDEDEASFIAFRTAANKSKAINAAIAAQKTALALHEKLKARGLDMLSSGDAKELGVLDLATALKTIPESIKSVEANRFVWPLSPGTAQVGSLGVFGHPTKCFQVIDESTMIVDVGEGKVVSFWLVGFPTKGVADGQKLNFGTRWFQVTGTRRYTTASGTARTLLQLALFEPQPPKGMERDAWEKIPLYGYGYGLPGLP